MAKRHHEDFGVGEKHHAKAHGVKHHVKKHAPKYILGIVAFVVLVALVYFLITFLSKAGAGRSSVAAIVNDEPITYAYLDEQYARIPAMYQAFISKATLLNQTINEVLLLQEATKEGIVVTDEDVKTELATALEKSGMTEEDLLTKLEEQNMTRDMLDELYKKQLIINKLLDKKIFSEMTVSEEAIKEYYDSQIRASHILVEKESEALDIIKQLKGVSKTALETKFGELAEKLSIDPSAKTNKGDLGEFSAGQMVQPFEEAAFALEEYEYTAKPVQTSYGYHVILRLPKEKSYEDSVDAIRETLMTQKKAEVVPAYLENLRKSAQITILYKEPAAVATK